LPLHATAEPDTMRLLISEGPRDVVLRAQGRDRFWKVVSDWANAAHLYDLTSDPAELHDVAAEHPALADSLLRRLLTTLRDSKSGTMVTEPIDASLIVLPT
jgi:hypothetical protein